MQDASVAFARPRAATTWQLVKGIARMDGIDPARLGRVRDAIYVGAGAEPACYADARQRPQTYVPGLSAKPWWDADAFRLTAKLRSRHKAIHQEAVRCYEAGRFRPKQAERIGTGRWTTCNLIYLGQHIDENLRHCPVTRGLLTELWDPCCYGLIYFCAIEPDTTLTTHFGHTNAKLRLQLNLTADGDCGLRIGGEERRYGAGEVVALDESFANEGWNAGATTRFALMVDVWHPELTPDEIRGFDLLSRVSINMGRRRRIAKRLARPR